MPQSCHRLAAISVSVGVWRTVGQTPQYGPIPQMEHVKSIQCPVGLVLVVSLDQFLGSSVPNTATQASVNLSQLRGRFDPKVDAADGTRNRLFPMTKSLPIAIITSLAITPVLSAGIDEVDVLFTMEFENTTLGTVILAETFTALQEDNGSGILSLTFGGDGFFSVSNPGFTFEYSNLDVLLQSDVINGGGDADLEASGSETLSTYDFNGFGSTWDGNFASGVGIVEFTTIGGFTADSYEISWSVNTIPAPGALSLFGMFGLAHRRRRN